MRLLSLFLCLLFLTGCGAAAASTNAAQTHAQANIDTVQPASTTATLTQEQAEAIALEHAGFTADQVTRLRARYEIDDGIPEYEVEFRVGRTEYDYTIHADTGEILSYDMDD